MLALPFACFLSKAVFRYKKNLKKKTAIHDERTIPARQYLNILFIHGNQQTTMKLLCGILTGQALQCFLPDCDVLTSGYL
jgi:hypothetical protein